MSLDGFSDLAPAQQRKLLDGPALPPPDGAEIDFFDPPNSTALAYIILSVCLTLSVVFASIRVYATCKFARKMSISEIVMLPGFCAYLAFVCVLFKQASHVGFFVHQWNYQLKQLPRVAYLSIIATNLFTVCISLIKGAITIEWLRIFNPGGRGRNNNSNKNAFFFWWTCHIMLVVNFAFYSMCIVVLNCSCSPHRKLWVVWLPGSCFDTRPFDIASAVLSVVLDLFLLVLPQGVIWRLNMSTTRKVAVGAVFAVGLIGCAAAIARVVVTVPYAESRDRTYDFCTVGLCTLAEMTCGCIIFCVPSVPSLALRGRRQGREEKRRNGNDTTIIALHHHHHHHRRRQLDAAAAENKRQKQHRRANQTMASSELSILETTTGTTGEHNDDYDGTNEERLIPFSREHPWVAADPTSPV